MESVGGRTPELRPEFLQQIGVRQQFVLNLRRKRIELTFEFGVEIYLPRHIALCLKRHMLSNGISFGRRPSLGLRCIRRLAKIPAQAELGRGILEIKLALRLGIVRR